MYNERQEYETYREIWLRRTANKLQAKLIFCLLLGVGSSFHTKKHTEKRKELYRLEDVVIIIILLLT